MIVQQALSCAANPVLSLINGASFRGIEARRAALLRNEELIDDIDYGAGAPSAPRAAETQRRGVRGRERVSVFAGYSKPARQCRILYYLVRLKVPAEALELGTCVGISAAYLAAAMKKNDLGHLWTIEGSPQVADLAAQTLTGLGLDGLVSIVRGPLHVALAPVLRERKFDLVFVDAHHDGAATVGYFEEIKPHLRAGAIVVFDDIDWSDGMQAAWARIAVDPAVAEHRAASGIGFVTVGSRH